MIALEFDFSTKPRRVSISAPKGVRMKTAEAIVKIQSRLLKNGYLVKIKPALV